jgi:hypothetical protein
MGSCISSSLRITYFLPSVWLGRELKQPSLSDLLLGLCVHKRHAVRDDNDLPQGSFCLHLVGFVLLLSSTSVDGRCQPFTCMPQRVKDVWLLVLVKKLLVNLYRRVNMNSAGRLALHLS